MMSLRGGYLTGMTVLFYLSFGLCSPAAAAPGPWQLKQAQDPLLVRARSFDIYFQPPEQVDQYKAEQLYLEFIRRNPDSPFVPYLYFHLAHTYTDWVDDRLIPKYHLVEDYDKAREYFLKTMKHLPPDRISGLRLAAQVSAASVAPTEKQQVAEYIDYYKRLDGITRKAIAERLWLTKDARRKPRKAARVRKQFWKSLDGKKKVANMNLIGIAEDRPELLKEIVAALPNTPPGRRARAILNNKYHEQLVKQEPPPPKRTPPPPSSSKVSAVTSPPPTPSPAPAAPPRRIDDGWNSGGVTLALVAAAGLGLLVVLRRATGKKPKKRKRRRR